MSRFQIGMLGLISLQVFLFSPCVTGCSESQSTLEKRKPASAILNVEDARDALTTLLFDDPQAFGEDSAVSGLELMKSEPIRSGNLNVVDFCGIEVDLEQKVFRKWVGMGRKWEGKFNFKDGVWRASSPEQKNTR